MNLWVNERRWKWVRFMGILTETRALLWCALFTQSRAFNLNFNSLWLSETKRSWLLPLDWFFLPLSSFQMVPWNTATASASIIREMDSRTLVFRCRQIKFQPVRRLMQFHNLLVAPQRTDDSWMACYHVGQTGYTKMSTFRLLKARWGRKMSIHGCGRM